MRSAIAAVLMLMAAAAGAAAVNKCVDKSGKVVGYADECPAGTRSDKLDIKTPPAPAATPAGAGAPQLKSLAERDADFRKRQIEKQEADAKADKKSAETAERKRACEQAQAYLKALQSGQRVARIDPRTGERTFLADEDYPRELADAQRSVASNCK